MTISTLMQLRVSVECMVCEDAHLRGVNCFCFSCTRMGEGGELARLTAVNHKGTKKHSLFWLLAAMAIQMDMAPPTR